MFVINLSRIGISLIFNSKKKGNVEINYIHMEKVDFYMT
jgi:hypothetical protein